MKSPKSSVILVKFTFFPAISGKIFVLFCHVCDPSYDQVQTQKFLIAVQNVTNDSFWLLVTTWLSEYLRNMCFYHILSMIKSKYLRHCHSLIESDWHSFQVYSTTNYNAADRYRKSSQKIKKPWLWITPCLKDNNKVASGFYGHEHDAVLYQNFRSESKERFNDFDEIILSFDLPNHAFFN